MVDSLKIDIYLYEIDYQLTTVNSELNKFHQKKIKH